MTRGNVSAKMREIISSYCVKVAGNIYVAKGVRTDYAGIIEGIRRAYPRTGLWGCLVVWYNPVEGIFERDVVGTDFWNEYDFSEWDDGYFG